MQEMLAPTSASSASLGESVGLVTTDASRRHLGMVVGHIGRRPTSADNRAGEGRRLDTIDAKKRSSTERLAKELAARRKNGNSPSRATPRLSRNT